MIVTATWVRGHEVMWYEWVAIKGVYINTFNGKINTPKDLLMLAQQRQDEGWQLCRTVV